MTGHFFAEFRTVALIFTIVGSIAVITGLRTLVRHLVLRRRAHRTSGVVTGLEQRLRNEHGRRRTYYYPVVAFRTAEGRDVQTRAGVGTTWRRHRPGDRLTVSYDPHDPSTVYLGSGAAIAVSEVLAVGVGAVFVAIGCAQLFANGLPPWLYGGG